MFAGTNSSKRKQIRFRALIAQMCDAIIRLRKFNLKFNILTQAYAALLIL